MRCPPYGVNSKEEEANKWAGDFLIPPASYAEICQVGVLSKALIKEFAADLGIAPGIVVGRLQHDHFLPRNHCNDLKVRLEWAAHNYSTN